MSEGILKSSGLSCVPLNSTAPFNIDVSKGAFKNAGDTFLPFGWVEPNIDKYPDATINHGVFTGEVFSSPTSYPYGICWDGTHFWVVGSGSNNKVYQIDGTGSYTGVNFSVATQTNNPYGICWDGTNFWVCDSVASIVFKYSATGIYSGFNFSVNDEANLPLDICFDGTHLWLADNTTDKVYKYTTAGVYTGTNHSYASQETQAQGLCWDGVYFWLVGSTSVYQYTSQWVFTGVQFNANYSNCTGIAFVNGYLWILSNGSDNISQYFIKAIGNPIAKIDSDSGLPLCLRVQ